jgi:uncharacterized membrane protein
MTTHPRIVQDNRRSPLPLILQLLSYAGVVACALIPKVFWTRLPDKVPAHFGWSGKPDAWAGKDSLVAMMAFGLVFYGFITFAGWVSHHTPQQSMEKLTEEQMAKRLEFRETVIRWVKVLFIWLVVALEWGTVRIAIGRADRLGMAFDLITAGLVVFVVWAVAMAMRITRSDSRRNQS